MTSKKILKMLKNSVLEWKYVMKSQLHCMCGSYGQRQSITVYYKNLYYNNNFAICTELMCTYLYYYFNTSSRRLCDILKAENK